jgi:hypothetical protein
MKKRLRQAITLAGVAACQMAAHGSLPPSLFEDGAGFINSTNATAHGWFSVPVQNAGPRSPQRKTATIIEAEMQAEEGSIHIAVGDETNPSATLAYGGAENGVLFFEAGEFPSDFAGFSSDAAPTALRVRMFAGGGKLRAEIKTTVNGKTTEETRIMKLSNADAREDFQTLCVSLQGNARIRISARSVQVGALFLVR